MSEFGSKSPTLAGHPDLLENFLQAEASGKDDPPKHVRKDATSLKELTRYRPEIDGLRAVAVIPVILFHMGIQHMGG